MNQSPLGAARSSPAPTYPIDRALTAQLLGFNRPTENSLDSVSDRDFAIEFSAFASILMTHMSRFSEELVLWTLGAIRFYQLAKIVFAPAPQLCRRRKTLMCPSWFAAETGRGQRPSDQFINADEITAIGL